MTNIITISREFGSGGHEIGEHVAQQLGWKFYDRHIVEQVAKESGLSEKFIEESGEYATSRSSLLFNLSIAGAAMGSGSLSLYDEIYVEQCKLIKKLAAESPCVIVGRCADYVLRERQDCMHIFIWADVKARIERISGQVKEAKARRRCSRNETTGGGSITGITPGRNGARFRITSWHCAVAHWDWKPAPS